MYLKQKCPHCGTDKEFVYVQIGHVVNCKNCNAEFTLQPKRFVFVPYLIYLGVALAAVALLIYLGKTFHDWWIYR